MASDYDQTEAIAAEWEVDPDLLSEAEWELEDIDTNDGLTVGYFVRFSEDTDRALLDQLGVAPGQTSRQVSLNAFDVPDFTDEDYDRDTRRREGFDGTSQQHEPDNGVFSIDEPFPDLVNSDEDRDLVDHFPDLPAGQAYLTDQGGRVLTDGDGRPLIVESQPLTFNGQPFTLDVPVQASSSGGENTSTLYAGSSLTGRAFARDDQARGIEILRGDMVSRLDHLESLLRLSAPTTVVNRGHNHPPELLDLDRPPKSLRQSQQILNAVDAVRQQSSSAVPDVAAVEKQVSKMRRIAKAILGVGATVSAYVALEVANLEIGLLHTQYREAVVEALTKAADAAMAWAHAIAAMG